MKKMMILMALMLICGGLFAQQGKNVKYVTKKNLPVAEATVSYSVDTLSTYYAREDADILSVNTGTTTPTACTVYLNDIAVGNQVVVLLNSGTATITVRAASATINNSATQTITSGGKTFFRKNAFKFYMW